MLTVLLILGTIATIFYIGDCKKSVTILKNNLTLIHTTNIPVKSKAKASLEMVSRTVQTIYTNITQKIRSSIIVEGNKYTLHYILNNQLYTIKLKGGRPPSRVIDVLDEYENSVMDSVRSFMGPREDFHDQIYTPIDLGYLSLTFVTVFGDKTFSTNESIIL